MRAAGFDSPAPAPLGARAARGSSRRTTPAADMRKHHVREVIRRSDGARAMAPVLRKQRLATAETAGLLRCQWVRRASSVPERASNIGPASLLLYRGHLRRRTCAARSRSDRGDPSRRCRLVPPNEKHWHGAAPTTAMTHIAMQEALGGKVVEWMEKVSDEEYGA